MYHMSLSITFLEVRRVTIICRLNMQHHHKLHPEMIKLESSLL